MADGQVKLFAVMLHEDKVMIAQHRVPDDTNEITQVKQLLDEVDLTGAVVTADAAHAQHDTAQYVAGERGPDYLLAVKGNQPGLQRGCQTRRSAATRRKPARSTPRARPSLSTLTVRSPRQRGPSSASAAPSRRSPTATASFRWSKVVRMRTVV